MKTHHLWVLGVLLLAIGLLAFLGFFKSQEGFTTPDVYFTTTDKEIPNINMTGYGFKNLQINGTFVKHPATGADTTVPIARAVELDATANDGQFILAILDGRYVKMVLVQFTKDSNTRLNAKLRSAGYYVYPDGTTVPTVLTDTIVRDVWARKTADIALYSGTSITTEGYGIKNISVRIVREIPAGKTASDVVLAANANTVNPAKDMIRCPTGYTFFNGPNGDSMCCNGTINPYTHMCEGVEIVKESLCAFGTDVPDPRREFAGEFLGDCSDIGKRSTLFESSACPTTLPYYAKETEETQKCCKNPTQLFGDTGFTCSDADLADTAKYCILRGVPVGDEVMCDEATVNETAACPTDVTGKQVFQNISYIMGDREANRYDISSLKGKQIPACFRMNEVCIPEAAIQYAQKQGAYTEYDADTWEYSCNVWAKKNRGDLVNSVKGYLDVPMSVVPGPAPAPGARS